MTTRLVILSGLLLCGSLASGKNELSFKETVVPVKVAPDQDSITASFPFTNTSGTPVTISKIHVSCDCTTAGAKDNRLTYAPGESGVISAVMKTGNFSGTVDKDMTVHANGSAYKPVPSVTSGDVSLAEGTDFTVAYLDSYGSAVRPSWSSVTPDTSLVSSRFMMLCNASLWRMES